MGATAPSTPPPGVGPGELCSAWGSEPTDVPGWDCECYGHLFEPGDPRCIHCGSIARASYQEHEPDEIYDDEAI